MLVILRLIASIVLAIMAPFKGAAYLGLLRFVRGTGDKWSLNRVPGARAEMLQVYATGAILQEDPQDGDCVSLRWEDTEQYGRVRGDLHLSHTSGYNGRGFTERPTLFYTLGRFHAQVRETDTEVIISGSDPYLWGPEGVDENGEERWFSIPINCPSLIWRGLQFVFGKTYFTDGAGTVTGYRGISHRLWKDMEAVGAAPYLITWCFRYTNDEVLSATDLCASIAES